MQRFILNMGLLLKYLIELRLKDLKMDKTTQCIVEEFILNEWFS